MPTPETAPALICDDRCLTRAELASRAARVAALIRSAGAEAGDAVAVMLPNGTEFIETGLGAGAAGCPVVPVNWHLRAEEASWLIGDSGSKVLFVAAEHEETARRAAAAAAGPGPRIVVTGRSGPDSYEEALAAVDAPTHDGEADELVPPLHLYYTSGTTGRPRGVEREGPPPDMRRQWGGLAAMWGIGTDDVWLACTPLYHAAAGYAYATLMAGGTVVIQRRWDPREWMRLVQEHRVTACFMVPAHFIRVLEVPPEERDAHDLSSMRLILHSAAPCPVPVKWQILDAIPGAEIWEFYGATEGGVTRISPDEWKAHPGSVGRPWPGVEVKVLDEAGGECGPGQTGQIWIKPAGGAAFRYRNDPAKTERAWRDGFFTVGEIGHLDEEGFLYITDRSSDLVLRGGVNIYPAEIETVLHRHPAVVDCAVFGVPDQRLGEELKALVEVREEVTPEQLREFCREHLADFKVPREIELVDTLPRDPAGKVAKRHLRAAATLPAT